MIIANVMAILYGKCENDDVLFAACYSAFIGSGSIIVFSFKLHFRSHRLNRK